MAGCALGLTFEKFFAASRRVFIEAAHRRLWRSNAQLIELQVGEFRRDQIGGISNVAKPRSGCYGKLRRIVEPRIEERSLTMHLQICHESIPVRHRTPSRPS